MSAVLFFFAVLLVAFVADLGVILVTKWELQKAADSAALAAASKILVAQPSGNPLGDGLAGADIANAVAEAKKFCLLNRASGINLTLLDSDVVVGYVDYPTDPASPLVPWAAGHPYPNTAQVKVRRDSQANSPIALFFANVIGMASWGGYATATACASRYYPVTGFDSSTLNSPLLPLAVDAASWDTFLNRGTSPDGQVHDAYTAIRPTSTTWPPDNVASGRDNVPEFTDAYPKKNDAGSIGLVCIGPSANDTPSFSDWILNGSSPADMASFGRNGIQATPSSPLIMQGGPGMKPPLQRDFQSIIGQPRVVPLFSSVSGNGNNTRYTIVGFAGVTVVAASGSGSNMQLTLQPMVVIDPTTTTDAPPTWNDPDPPIYIYPLSPLALIR